MPDLTTDIVQKIAAAFPDLLRDYFRGIVDAANFSQIKTGKSLEIRGQCIINLSSAF
jgi:hypothetical protein